MMEVRVEDSFELLTQDEWNKYLSADFFEALRIDIEGLGITERSFFHPRLEEMVSDHNNKVGSLIITYALCKHYYDKGIPDEPWYISPGHEGQSIQYMPNFEEEHWMRHYWFNYFSDTFYLKLSAVWDSIIDILNHYYGLDYVEDLRLRSNVMKWLKKEKNDVFSVFEEVQNSQLYKDAQKYRTAAAHGTSAGEVSRTVDVKKDVEREIPSIDKNGVITKRKVRVTEISVGAGEYTTVNTIMKNIEEYTRYSGIKIQEIIQKMQ